jgi:two-component system response regulator RegX3
MLPPRLLIVEDEDPIREGVAELFSLHDFAVDVAADGREASALLARERYALIVLDLMIPPPTGLELLTALRARGDTTPVLVLTARGSEEDVVEGLERGADDYVTKPFGIKALVARARGLLRRSALPPESGPPAPVALGGAVVDLAAARVTYGAHLSLSLTAREVSLLQFLLQHRDRVVSRAELLVQVWGYRDGNIETRTVDVHLVKLRKKLAAVPGGEHWIETSRGLGYRLVVA